MSNHKFAVAAGILTAFLAAGTVSAQPSAPIPQQHHSEVAGNEIGSKSAPEAASDENADDSGSEGKGKGKGKSEGKGKGKGKGKKSGD
ncbi:hypothetical protein [Nocardia sp. XZ_19_231]|uniref:hypothetical protein n=1 Tax=Nocardia sp. XZ_19_231 TaxID=2769252 RepID=UPI00188FB78A|nr:hypothetical protein [Nocardia sp. XZ_19_231]